MSASHKREIAFIDPGVDDLQTLLAGIRPDVEPILLTADEPASRQMARAVRGREGLQAIHVIAHGQPGEVSFGAGVLSVETMAKHSDDLARLGPALGVGGLRLWTCESAHGERGSAFIDTLACMVGAQVAGSTRLVGSKAKGGQWTLDVGATGLPPLSAEGAAAYAGVMTTTTSTTVNDNNTSANLALSTGTTTNATVNLNNSSGNDSVTTDGSGSTTVNGNNSTGNDEIDIDNASSATVNLNNSTGNDDVDITGTTINATVNDNNSGVVGGTDEIDITGTAVTATVNLNNSLGNDTVSIVGASSTNATVNLNNSGGKDTINVGSTTGATTATVNLNSSGGTDIVNVVGATTTATVNLANSTGKGDVVELLGKGTGTINAVNSTGNDTLIGANSTDTITGGSGNDTVELRGAGTINAGAGNDLGIYTLSDHYSINSSGQLQSLNGDVDTYNGQGGTNTLDIVLTTAQWNLPLVQSDLASYAAFLSTNPGPNQTFTFHFGATSGALTVAGWQDLNVQIAGGTLLAATGVEGSPTALNLATAVAGFPGGSLSSLLVGAIPLGATLSDGHGNSFTADATHTSVDVHSWNLSTLTITPTNDTNFPLSITATKTEGSGAITTAATEGVTVDPTAPTVTPVAATGNEGSAIGLNLGTAVTGLPGDSNSLASLVVGAIPLGATITDGTSAHTFTASTTSGTSVDVASWNLSTLTITSAEEGSFKLTIAATEKDAEGNLSTTTTRTESITVADAALTAGTVTVSGGVEGTTAAALSATFSDANANAPASDFSGTISWGDGQTSSFDSSNVTANGNGAFTVSGLTHLYAEDTTVSGPDSVSVAISDVGGSTANASSTTTVADAALSATGVAVTATEGNSSGVVTVATFTDGNPSASATDSQRHHHLGRWHAERRGTIVSTAQRLRRSGQPTHLRRREAAPRRQRCDLRRRRQHGERLQHRHGCRRGAERDRRRGHGDRG